MPDRQSQLRGLVKRSHLIEGDLSVDDKKRFDDDCAATVDRWNKVHVLKSPAVTFNMLLN